MTTYSKGFPFLSTSGANHVKATATNMTPVPSAFMPRTWKGCCWLRLCIFILLQASSHLSRDGPPVGDDQGELWAGPHGLRDDIALAAVRGLLSVGMDSLLRVRRRGYGHGLHLHSLHPGRTRASVIGTTALNRILYQHLSRYLHSCRRRLTFTRGGHAPSSRPSGALYVCLLV